LEILNNFGVGINTNSDLNINNKSILNIWDLNFKNIKKVEKTSDRENGEGEIF
jgi:hypothetical protein